MLGALQSIAPLAARFALAISFFAFGLTEWNGCRIAALALLTMAVVIQLTDAPRWAGEGSPSVAMALALFALAVGKISGDRIVRRAIER